MEKTISNVIYKKLEEAKKIAAMYPEKSYKMSKEAYDMSKERNLKVEEGYSLISMAFACRAKSEVNKMLDCSFKALEIFEAVNDSLGQVKSLNLIGISYFYNSMYEDSLKYLLQIKDLIYKVKDDFLLSCVLNNIGEVYRESFMYDKAVEYYLKALKICTDNSFRLNTASILGNIGEIYFVENKYNEALEYFNKSYDILINEKDMVTLGEIENKLGKAYFAVENYVKAEECFFCALNRLDNISNKYYAIDVLINIAKFNLSRDLNEPIYYYERALSYADSIKAKKKLSEVYKLISEYYEKIDDFKTALEYYKNYSRVNEEVSSSNLGNKLEILRVEMGHLNDGDKYEKIKNRLEKEILNQKNELEKIKKSNEVLQRKAYEDELTGVPNRRFINRYINNIWKNPLINDETIVLFMIDIDNFKIYNDYWGHSKGDECLKKVASCINDIKMLRGDVFGRYGGEEFVYIAKGLNYEQALELGDLIRKEVEQLNINYVTNNKSKLITISVGGAIGKILEFKCTPNILQLADKELYSAKDMGRNIVLLKNISEFSEMH